MTTAAFKHYFRCECDARPTLSAQTGDETSCRCGKRYEVDFDHSRYQIMGKPRPMLPDWLRWFWPLLPA